MSGAKQGSGGAAVRVRTILKVGGPEIELKAREERARFTQKLRRRRRAAKTAKYNQHYRLTHLESERERKRRWREDNREHVNAYYRRYDELAPGRREYKAGWMRDARARAGAQ